MRRCLVPLVLACLLVAPAPASAAAPKASIDVVPGAIHLIARTIVSVDVTFTCTLPKVPAGADVWFEGPYVDARIVQASGRRLATAWDGVAIDPVKDCDGRPHARTITLVPEGAPLRTGRAMLQVSGDLSYDWESEDDWGMEVVHDTTGWLRIRVRRCSRQGPGMRVRRQARRRHCDDPALVRAVTGRTTPGLSAAVRPDDTPIPGGNGSVHASGMEALIPAEELPTLYRSVLETVARLERAGERAYAWELRRKALATYSTRWDERGRRTLVRLDRDGRIRLEATRRVPRTAGVSTVSEAS